MSVLTSIDKAMLTIEQLIVVALQLLFIVMVFVSVVPFMLLLMAYVDRHTKSAMLPIFSPWFSEPSPEF
jgi:hypothetical protein